MLGYGTVYAVISLTYKYKLKKKGNENKISVYYASVYAIADHYYFSPHLPEKIADHCYKVLAF